MRFAVDSDATALAPFSQNLNDDRNLWIPGANREARRLIVVAFMTGCGPRLTWNRR